MTASGLPWPICQTCKRPLTPTGNSKPLFKCTFCCEAAQDSEPSLLKKHHLDE
jgi:tRNA(Ile2) C34 agmatinyltransferase TiaS